MSHVYLSPPLPRQPCHVNFAAILLDNLTPRNMGSGGDTLDVRRQFYCLGHTVLMFACGDVDVYVYVYVYVFVYMRMCVCVCPHNVGGSMGWLRLVGSLKL